MRLEMIRAENLDSPGWLDRLTDRYKRDAKEKEIRKADQKQKERLELVNEIATKINKEEPAITTEVEKPTPTEDKVDEKSVLELIKEIVEILNSHTEAIEALADKIDEISSVQATRPTGRAPVTQNELSERDLEIINSRFELAGLNGEIRKIRPFTIIGGQLAE